SSTYPMKLILSSFPTRRSSDLDSGFACSLSHGLLDTITGSKPRACPQQYPKDPRRPRWRAWSDSADGLAVFGLASRIQHDFRSRDRKSTRLNSSHDQISYAVFC